MKRLLVKLGSSLKKKLSQWLFWLWLILGIIVLTKGNITRIEYACPWLLVLIDYIVDACNESKEADEDDRQMED